MTRLSFVVGAGVAAVSAGCGANPATQERQTDTSKRPQTIARTSTISVPQNPVDLAIRRDLDLAIARDEELKNREISFIVANGDVSVTGTVRTEQERKRINELVMNISEVKSVANALLIAE